MRSRPATSNRWHHWRRSTSRAAVLGAIATMVVASAASAVPSEPDESAECHPYGTGIDDCGFYPDPPDDGDSPNQNNSDDPADDCESVNYGFDIIKLTGNGVDFGDGSFAFGAPVRMAPFTWSVPDCDYYTARLVGTLHTDGVSGKFARMHVSYWWYGDRIDIRHSSNGAGHRQRHEKTARQPGTLHRRERRRSPRVHRDQQQRCRLRHRQLQDPLPLILTPPPSWRKRLWVGYCPRDPGQSPPTRMSQTVG